MYVARHVRPLEIAIVTDREPISHRPGWDDAAESLARDLELIAQRDLAALSRLYNATYRRLFAICLRITQNRESAEDVLQEVYIKVWNRAAGYDRTLSQPITWLGRLARNSAIDWYRAQARRASDSPYNEAVEQDDAKPIDEQIIDRESETRAVSLLEELGDDQRKGLREIFFEGLTYSELARREGIPLGTVKSRVHRAILNLSKKWQSD